MRPYLIINGKSSKEIHGLIIQSLPPITKARMRTETETVDGRDGEIVTELGYEAYNKTISIGLTETYKLDDVISFFSQSGIVTFSDELDKYYRFAIYDQIDYNRLIRWRTATVTMRVQPFKYSAVEPDFIWQNTEGRTTATLYVHNGGNIYSKPRLLITGKDDVNFYINNKNILRIQFGSVSNTIIVDAETMNATDPDGNFKNRQVIGNYSDIDLHPGDNEIYMTGQCSKLIFERYSRWL